MPKGGHFPVHFGECVVFTVAPLVEVMQATRGPRVVDLEVACGSSSMVEL
jgi:hypothetical protein